MDLAGKQRGKSPAFDKADPYSLRLANTSMVIAKNVLTCKELVSIMTKCHKTVEVIRRGPTGTPGPAFPNARLRTDPGNPVTAPGGLRPSSYLQEPSRLVVTRLSRQPPTERYPYGMERAEDLAGVGIAVVIWASAAFAG